MPWYNKCKYILLLPILDVDECSSQPCHANGTCNNTVGSYFCVCNPGFTSDGSNCTGIDNTLTVKVVPYSFTKLWML